MGAVKIKRAAERLQMLLQRTPEAAAHPVSADFMRVFASFFVVWFHIWQQSWVGSGKWMTYARSGAAMVDVLILLSAFCLYLPYAMAKAQGRTYKGTGALAFYRKRAVRILPSYYACLAFSICLSVYQNGWSASLGKDILAHLLLVHQLIPSSYTGTQLNGVFWTLTVLALFYLIFPLLSRVMQNYPIITLAVLGAVQLAWSLYALSYWEENNYSLLFNQFPAFAGVIGLGMLGAILYAYMVQSRVLQSIAGKVICTLLGLGAVWYLLKLLQELGCTRDYQKWQLVNRMPLAAAACAAIVLFGAGLPIPGGKLWRWLSGITYNLYLWHQMLVVWFKYTLHIPGWSGELPPNQTGDTEWMACYNLLAWAVSLAAAVIFTYLVEKPAAKLLQGRKAKAK